MSHLTKEQRINVQNQLKKAKETYDTTKEEYRKQHENMERDKFGEIVRKGLKVVAPILLGPLVGGALSLGLEGIEKGLLPGEVDYEATQQDEEETMARLQREIDRNENELQDRTPEEQEEIRQYHAEKLAEAKTTITTPDELKAAAILKDETNHSTNQIDWAKTTTQGKTNREGFRHRRADAYFDKVAQYEGPTLINRSDKPWI